MPGRRVGPVRINQRRIFRDPDSAKTYTGLMVTPLPTIVTPPSEMV